LEAICNLLVEKIGNLDVEDENIGLSLQEIEDRKNMLEKFWKLAWRFESIARQKSWVKWL